MNSQSVIDVATLTDAELEAIAQPEAAEREAIAAWLEDDANWKVPWRERLAHGHHHQLVLKAHRQKIASALRAGEHRR